MRVGFTGHRDFNERLKIRSWMRGISAKYPDATIISGGAIGADLLCAEEAIEAKLHSKVILPMWQDVYTAKWPEAFKKRLDAVVESSEVECIQGPLLTDGARYELELLFERNQRIVDESDVLIAFWDGRQRGGTFDCVRRALAAELSVFNGFSS